MRISDWSSDVCSSDLIDLRRVAHHEAQFPVAARNVADRDLGVAPAQFRADLLLHRSEERREGKVCQYVYISVVAVTLKKKQHIYLLKYNVNNSNSTTNYN